MPPKAQKVKRVVNNGWINCLKEYCEKTGTQFTIPKRDSELYKAVKEYQGDCKCVIDDPHNVKMKPPKACIPRKGRHKIGLAKEQIPPQPVDNCYEEEEEEEQEEETRVKKPIKKK